LERLNELSTSEKLISGGGLLMLIASFLPWYKISFDFGEFGGGSVSANGWEAPGAIWSILAVIVSVLMVAAVLGPKFANMKLPDMGQFTLGQVLAGGAGIIVVCVLLKLVNESSYLSFGFYVGIIAAALIAAGGYLAYTEEKAGVRRV
jgi:hypothetical protein